MEFHQSLDSATPAEEVLLAIVSRLTGKSLLDVALVLAESSTEVLKRVGGTTIIVADQDLPPWDPGQIADVAVAKFAEADKQEPGAN